MGQNCPNCGATVRRNFRYPDYLCDLCANRVTDEQGHRVEFFNEGLSGGCYGVVIATGEKYLAHDCYVDGLRCWADEARFGGIVIRPSPNGLMPKDGKRA